jgi:Ser/Thr protein kinase RdoA (MazF antagonist)
MDQVVELLRSRYGLAVESVVPARRGWTGETYVATTRDDGRVFVKVYPKHLLPPMTAPGLPVLAELGRAGLPVNRPIPSTSGELHQWLGDDLVVVFEYLDAVPVPFTFGGEGLGDLIAGVHQQSDRIASPIARETFAPIFADDVWRTLTRAEQEPAIDEPRRGLRRFLEEQRTAIVDGWAAFEEIARACRAASFDMVVTHGDWPFNLLQDAAGALILIDWDELLLAPAERDTWYAGEDAGFWRSYEARRPGSVESELATAYYVHHRYFEELVSFAQTVLGDESPERRAWSLTLLTGDWMAGLRARMGRSGRTP